MDQLYGMTGNNLSQWLMNEGQYGSTVWSGNNLSQWLMNEGQCGSTVWSDRQQHWLLNEG